MILLALFQRRLVGFSDHQWSITAIGTTFKMDVDDLPKHFHDGEIYSGAGDPIAIGLVTVSHDGEDVWRAECEHPDGGEVVVHGKSSKDEALDALRQAVRGR